MLTDKEIEEMDKWFEEQDDLAWEEEQKHVRAAENAWKREPE